MPWQIEKRDDEWCVVKSADGETEGCHASEQEAHDQMAALYANDPQTAGGPGLNQYEDKQGSIDMEVTPEEQARLLEARQTAVDVPAILGAEPSAEDATARLDALEGRLDAIEAMVTEMAMEHMQIDDLVEEDEPVEMWAPGNHEL